MNFRQQRPLAKLVTLLCLLALLLLGWRWLHSHQSRDLSFLLPIYQDGQEIQPSAMISEEGQVLLPVRAIAENNGWQSVQSTITGEDGGLWGGSLLLLEENSRATLGLCWFGSEQGQLIALGVSLNGQPLAVSSLGRYYQEQLYLPEDFFSNALGLVLKLDENGQANLTRPEASQQQA